MRTAMPNLARRRERRTGRVARANAAAPMPEPFAPMLATLGELPARPDDYSFEYKWDGIRAICHHDGRRMRLFSRNRRDITSHYPELKRLSEALDRTRCVLDGEIVALDEGDRPSFARLQRRMHVAHPSASLVRQVPVWYVLFDLLYLDGRALFEEPYTTRHQLLEETTVAGALWRVTPAHIGEGATMLETARANGLEGLVAKRLDSIYEPGRRSPAWIKIKVVQSQEFVVGGWIEQAGAAAPTGSRVGSLLIGYYDCHAKLRYAGGVGTGFDAREHARLAPLLAALARRTSPFADPVPSRAAGRVVRFVKPTLVVQVEYRRWPTSGIVQHAAYQGLRTDKDASQVVKEHPSVVNTE
jgi:bifunctional non-homologous end joining protein LigD